MEDIRHHLSNEQTAETSQVVVEALAKACVEITQIHQPGEVSVEKSGIPAIEQLFTVIASTKRNLFSVIQQEVEARAQEISAQIFRQVLHDLHNPVAALRQMIRIINDDEMDLDAKKQAMQSLPRIATQILRQVTATKANFSLPPIRLIKNDLRVCIESVYEAMSVKNQSKGRIINLTLPQSPFVISHDPQLLQIALTHLMTNALEASQSQVRMTLLECDGQAVIRVEDDGRGMSEAEVTLCLQGRFSTHQDESKISGSSGLSVVAHIVQAHKGKIIYRQSDLTGACFEIRLEAQ